MIVEFYGGLGNQMFQYAFFCYLKKKYPENEIKLNTYLYGEVAEKEGIELHRVFRNLEFPIAKKRDYGYLRYLHKCLKPRFPAILKAWKQDGKFVGDLDYKDDVIYGSSDYFRGFWQNAKYVDDDIKDIFQFPPFPKELKDLEERIRRENSVSIHVRRGDYLISDFRELTYDNFYEKAIEVIKSRVENPRFFVFSDDIEWCKSHFPNSEDFYFVDDTKGCENYVDMQTMALCKHNIIANSTYSWWAARLNKNTNPVVVGNSNFYKEGLGKSSEQIKCDLFLEDWIDTETEREEESADN